MAIIGIDLGTSNSAASILRGGRPVIIPSEGVSLGGKAFPSYVAVTADGQMLSGEPARRQAAANPQGGHGLQATDGAPREDRAARRAAR
jgi:molecular chaperone DnaK